MKKYISLFSFIAFLFVGIQNSQAQDGNRVEGSETPEVIAKKQTYELHQITELTGEQQRAVFKVLVDLNQNINALNNEGNIATVQESKASLMENVKARLKNILNEEQYKVYLRTLEKPKK